MNNKLHALIIWDPDAMGTKELTGEALKLKAN